ncbi:MAG: sigma 54-interacting transcriptional regulator, partial [Myxococcota bacterium]
DVQWRASLDKLQDVSERAETTRRIAGIVGLEVFDNDSLIELGREFAERGDAPTSSEVADVLRARGEERPSRLIRGRAAVKTGHYGEALAALEGVQGDVDDTAILARALYFAGRGAEALALVEEIEGELDGEALVSARDVAGHASFGLGDAASGITWLERSVEAAKGLGNPRIAARASHSLAIALHRSSDFDRAHALYEASLKTDDPLAATTRNLNFATLLHDRGRYEEAQARYEVAASRAEQLANIRELARARVNLANVLVTLGELADAQEMAESTARLCVEHGLEHAETMANLVLLEARIESERYEGARDALDAVRRGLSRINDAVAAAEAGLLEARLLVREGAAGMAVSRLRELDVPDVARLEARRVLELAYAAASDRECAERSVLTAHAVEAARGLGLEAEWRALALHAGVLREAGDSNAEHVASRSVSVFQEFTGTLSERARGAYSSTQSRRRLRERSKAVDGRVDSRVYTSTVSPAERPYRRLLSLNRQLAREADVETLLVRIVDAAIELLGAERGFILLESEGSVRVAVARNLDRKSLEGDALRFSRSIANDVFDSGEAVVTTNAQNDSRYAGALSVAASQIRSALCVPLRGIARDEDPLIGALYLDHRFQDRAFTEADVELCASFSDQATIALESARMVTRIRAQERSLEEQNQALERMNEGLQRDAAQAAEAAEAAIRRLREEGPTLGVGRGLEGIVGRSDGLRQALRFVDRFADTDVPVAVLGESGVGKELIARALHERSDRADHPFVSVNCGAIPEALIESELFGHVKGAFTGAHRDKPGLFAAARDGTLFLDEIAEMPL